MHYSVHAHNKGSRKYVYFYSESLILLIYTLLLISPNLYNICRSNLLYSITKSSNWKVTYLCFSKQSISLRKKGPPQRVTMMLISGCLKMSVHTSITIEKPSLTHVCLIFPFCTLILAIYVSNITVLNICSPGVTYDGLTATISLTISL